MQTILVQGPTASGKSSLAVALACRAGAVVINADAMQVYRDLSVISARPSEAEQEGVPHVLYGFVDASERFGVGRWLKTIERQLPDWQKQHQAMIFCGGTGLYLKALSEGLVDTPEIRDDVSKKVQADLAALGMEAFAEKLCAQNSRALEHIETVDTQRLIRSAEVLYQTRRPIIDWFEDAAPPLITKAFRVVLLPPREALYEKINRRCREMCDQAKDEITALNQRALDADLPAMRCLGVSHVQALLSGGQDLEPIVSDFAQKTRHYAKRQLTWLRHQTQADYVIEDFVDKHNRDQWCDKILAQINDLA